MDICETLFLSKSGDQSWRARELTQVMLDCCKYFFNLSEEEKQKSQGNHVWDPIRCGTSFSVEKVSFWRDFVKLFAHHVFHTPAKLAGLMYHQTVGKLDGSG